MHSRCYLQARPIGMSERPDNVNGRRVTLQGAEPRNRLDQSSLKEASRLECSSCVAGLYNTEEEHRLHAGCVCSPSFDTSTGRPLDWWCGLALVLFTPSRLLLRSRRSMMEVKPRTWKGQGRTGQGRARWSTNQTQRHRNDESYRSRRTKKS